MYDSYTSTVGQACMIVILQYSTVGQYGTCMYDSYTCWERCNDTHTHTHTSTCMYARRRRIAGSSHTHTHMTGSICCSRCRWACSACRALGRHGRRALDEVEGDFSWNTTVRFQNTAVQSLEHSRAIVFIFVFLGGVRQEFCGNSCRSLN